MSAFKSFAVAGAIGGDGHGSASLGGYIAKALLKTGATVKVLARAESAEKPSAKELIAAGATIVAVDYNDPASLEKAVTGVDVVVSALAAGGFAFQPALVDASKKAGVQLFVPSEFGLAMTTQAVDSPFYGKKLLQDKLKAVGLPYLLIRNGLFAERASLFVTPKDGQVEIVGDGKKGISFTACTDIASFLAHVLTTLPLSELANKAFSIEGSRATLASLVAAKSSDLKIKSESREDALARWKSQGDIPAFLRAEWDAGNGTVGDKTVNHLFPGWNPTPVQKLL